MMTENDEKNTKKFKNFVNNLNGHSKPVLCSILFLPSKTENTLIQEYLITGSAAINKEKILTGEFIIWDLKTGELKNKPHHGHSKAISALAVIASKENMRNDYLITGSEDGSIIVWKYQPTVNFEQLHSFNGYHKKDITSIAVYLPPKYYKDNESKNLYRYLFISASLDTGTSNDKAIVWDLQKIIDGKAEDPIIGRLGVDVDQKSLSDSQENQELTDKAINNKIVSLDIKSKSTEVSRKNQRKLINRNRVTIINNETIINELDEAVLNEPIINSNQSEKLTQDRKESKKHTDGILSVAIYVPKRKCVGYCDKCECKPLIVTGSWDKTIIIWDLETLSSLKKLKGHTKAVNSVFIFDPTPYYPQGNHNEDEKNGPGGSSPILVTGSMDMTIIIWDLLEQSKINKLPVKKKVLFRKIDPSENNSISESGHKSEINSIFVFDNSSEKIRPQIVSCDSNSHIIFWDLLSGHIIRTINYNSYFPGVSSTVLTSVIAYQYAPNNEDFVLISCSKSNSNNLVFWDFSSERKSYERNGHNNITILKIHDPKDKVNNPISIVADIKGIIEVWDIVENIKLLQLGKHPNRVNYIAINSVTQTSEMYDTTYELYVAACDSDKNIVLRKMQVRDNKATEIVDSRRIFCLNEFFYTINFVVVPHFITTNSSTYLVKGAGTDGGDITTKFWDIQRIIGLPKSSRSFNQKINENEKFLKIPDLVISHHDGHSDLVRCIVSYKPSNLNDKLVFMVTSSYDKSAIVWKLFFEEGKLTYEKAYTLEGHSDKVFTICIFREYIITGSFDSKVIIWSKSGKKLNELNDNPDSVTSIDVLDSLPNPLLITTGIGKLILLTELTLTDEGSVKTKVVNKLVRHKDRVCSLAVYNPSSESNTSEPILVSGGDDKSLMVWRDCFQISETMPTQAIVRDAFKYDIDSEKSWPLMREMTERYEVSLWIENCDLFYDAIMKPLNIMKQEKRQKILEFFKMFHPFIKKTIRYTNNSRRYGYRSLLCCAIDKVDDTLVLQIIIDCFLENINKDIEDPLTQRLYHPSYFIGFDDILFLGKKYPSLFIKFISEIKLIKSSYILNKTYGKIKIQDSSRSIVSSSRYNWKSDLWKHNIAKRRLDYVLHMFGSSEETKREVISYYLPLVNVGSREMLNAFVDISYYEGNVDIFNGDVGKIVLKYLWEKTYYISHRIHFIIYLFYVALFSYLIYKVQSLIHDYGGRGQYIAKVLNWVLLIFTIYYFILEILQIVCEHYDNRIFYKRTSIETSYDEKEKKIVNKAFDKKKYPSFFVAMKDHFLIFWNVIDITIISFVLTGTVMRISHNFDMQVDIDIPTYQPTPSPNRDRATNYPTSYPTMKNTINYPEISTIRIIFAVATIFVYFKILYFLRPFRSSGPLVSMIVQIAKDIAAFLIILLIMVCGFAQVFWILNVNSPSSPKFGSSIWHSYLYTFIYMMGQSIDPDSDFKNSASYTLNALILLAFMLFMILLMLNLLIALMNDSFGRVRVKGLAQWRLEQGYVMLEDVWTSSFKEVDPFIYVLKYASDSSNLVSENQLFDTDFNREKEKENVNFKIDDGNNLESPVKKYSSDYKALTIYSSKKSSYESIENKLDRLFKMVDEENFDKLFKLIDKENNKSELAESGLKDFKNILFNESVEDKLDKLMKIFDIGNNDEMTKLLQSNNKTLQRQGPRILNRSRLQKSSITDLKESDKNLTAVQEKLDQLFQLIEIGNNENVKVSQKLSELEESINSNTKITNASSSILKRGILIKNIGKRKVVKRNKK